MSSATKSKPTKIAAAVPTNSVNSVSTGLAHASKQLKYIVGGIIPTYYFDIPHEISDLLHTQGLPWLGASASLLTASLTTSIFIYLLIYLPLFKGVQPDYVNWRISPDLQTVVPVLTGSILTGYLILLSSLLTWSRLNIVQAVLGSIGSYALMFGLIGLLGSISPRSRRSHTA